MADDLTFTKTLSSHSWDGIEVRCDGDEITLATKGQGLVDMTHEEFDRIVEVVMTYRKMREIAQ